MTAKHLTFNVKSALGVLFLRIYSFLCIFANNLNHKPGKFRLKGDLINTMSNIRLKNSDCEPTVLPDRFVITVGRRMGSGGRVLGKMIAERLGIAFYDKELLLDAARHSGLSPEVFEQNDERRPRYIGGLFSFNLGMNAHSGYTSSPVVDDALYKAQCDFIHKIAAEGPCVIVGRTADYILRDFPNVLNIFVHADIDDCAQRICARDKSLNFEQARRLAEKTNKLRSSFYNFYTDKRWGDSSGYDMTFNSSTMSLEQIADLVIDYLKIKYKGKIR